MNRRRFLKYAGATAAVVGASAFGVYCSTSKMTSLSYTPVRVINDKVYDIRVDVEVSNPRKQLLTVQVSLLPVAYEHLPSEAFPKEDPRATTLQPAGPEKEILSTVFSDLKGGREYGLRAVAADSSGMVDERTSRTNYIREFENLGAILESKGVTVIADYYTWYESPGKPNAAWGAQGTQHAHVYMPLLGEYDSADPTVIARHIDWATGYGINAFAISWCGETSTNPNSPGANPNDLPKLEGAFLQHRMLNQMKFFVLYENNDRLKIQNPDDPSEKWVEDLDDPFNRDRLVSDFEYLTEYFTHPSYLRVDGRPVMIFDYMASFRGDVRGVFRRVRDSVKADHHTEPYLVNDLAMRAYYPEEIINSSHPHIQQIVESTDAIGYGTPYCYLCYDLEEPYRLWHAAAVKYGKDYLPYSMPGFEPSPNVLPNAQPVHRDPEVFRKLITHSIRYATRGMVGIKAFNEWYWGHQIEPATEYGFTYLQSVRDCAMKLLG